MPEGSCHGIREGRDSGYALSRSDDTPWGLIRGPCENSFVAPYTWTVREGSLDGPVVMREYIYDVPDKEPVEGQELYLSNGSGPWRVSLRELVPAMPRSPYNVLVVERVE